MPYYDIGKVPVYRLGWNTHVKRDRTHKLNKIVYAYKKAARFGVLIRDSEVHCVGASRLMTRGGSAGYC